LKTDETTHSKNELLLQKGKLFDETKMKYDLLLNKYINFRWIKPKEKVMFTITTCKRFDLFERTMNSFTQHCKDINMISRWVCVDDNSSEEDRKKMMDKYPFIEFIFKNEENKGHSRSMNIIQEISKHYDYVLHMEDDWEFFESKYYIKPALEIMKENSKIGQVLFNKNYAEVKDENKTIKGGIKHKTSKNIEYLIHEHYQEGTKEHKEFFERNGPCLNCLYWPHFSFRPSILRRSVYDLVGRFNELAPHFEMEYAKRYFPQYESAFYDSISCIHIGKKTWETKPNAYNLNNVKQFS
jgi:hypothetical protein